MRALQRRCFDCGEALAGSTLDRAHRRRDEPVCCTGCLAVAELIAGAGLIDYYRLREIPAGAQKLAERR